jgi:DNA-binding beta-propeller fold protein YncE
MVTLRMLRVVFLSAAVVLGSAAPAVAEPGDLQWVSRYDGGFDDSGNAVAVSPDGSKVFVTGSSDGDSFDGNTFHDYMTVAYDAGTGAPLWDRRYNGPGHGPDDAEALAVSPDGTKLFVTGRSVGNIATVAYDTGTGATIWTKRYNGPASGPDEGWAIAVSPDGSKVFVSGASTGSNSFDYRTLAYDAGTGASLWNRGYNGSGNDYDFAVAVAVSPDGSNVFVTGFSYGSTSREDYRTIAYNAATGAAVWNKRYNYNYPGTGADRATAVVVSPDSSKVFVTGWSLRGNTASTDFATLAYNAGTGAVIWTKRSPGRAAGDPHFGKAIAVSPDGTKVFVTGRSQDSAPLSDYITIAYNVSNGVEAWNKLYNSGGYQEDYAEAVAVSPDGTKVLVTGTSGTGLDYATLAYDPGNGDTVFTWRYNGAANSYDAAYAVAVSPDSSKVFVTGISNGAATYYDFATLAYTA